MNTQHLAPNVGLREERDSDTLVLEVKYAQGRRYSRIGQGHREFLISGTAAYAVTNMLIRRKWNGCEQKNRPQSF